MRTRMHQTAEQPWWLKNGERQFKYDEDDDDVDRIVTSSSTKEGTNV